MHAHRFAKRRGPAGLLAAALLAVLALAMARPPAAWAQGAPGDTTEARQVEIVAPSDSLIQTSEGGTRVRKLIGNVRLRQGTTRLSADRATQYLGRNEILFTGDVFIVDEGDSLWADRVRYDSGQKVGRATGRVRVADGQVTLTGPTGRYFFREKHAVFPERVTLVDSARVLKSRSGEYFSKEKRAEFYQDVRAFSDSTYLEADSVTYLRDTEVSEARGRVFIERRGDRAEQENGRRPADSVAAARADSARADSARSGTSRRDVARRRSRRKPLPVDTVRAAPTVADTTARTLLFGHYAYNDPRAKYSRVVGRALLVRLQPPDAPDSAGAARPDTLIVQAHQLETTRADTLRRLTATDSVRLWQKDLQALADSAVYDEFPPDGSLPDSAQVRRRETRLFGVPLAWSEDAQLSGDTLRVTGRAGAVRRLFARGNAFAVQEDTTLGRLQQLKGRRITGYFAEKEGNGARNSAGETELRRLSSGPNAEAIFFPKKEGGQPGGGLRASSDSIRFQVRAGEVRRIGSYSGIEGARYDEENLPDPFRLDGMVWVPERRPRKAPFLGQERVHRRLPRPAPPEVPSLEEELPLAGPSPGAAPGTEAGAAEQQ